MPPSTLQAALRRRADLAASADTDTYRIVNRGGDGLPDLAVDRFADVLIAHLYGSGSGPPTQALRWLADASAARAVYVKRRPAQASTLSAEQRAALAPATPLMGEPVEAVIARENGLRYLIRPADGLSVGLFPDMRQTRAWVRGQAAGQTVLNCFAYTCGFGLAATAGGAARAVNLDVSRRVLNWGRENYALNGLATEAGDFIAGDVFDWLNRFARRRQRFDMVIIDPPSYSTTKRTRFSIERDYEALVELAARAVAAGGWLIACANAAELSTPAFKKKVRAGLHGFPARLHQITHEPEVDFPPDPPAGPYLKIALVRF